MELASCRQCGEVFLVLLGFVVAFGFHSGFRSSIRLRFRGFGGSRNRTAEVDFKNSSRGEVVAAVAEPVSAQESSPSMSNTTKSSSLPSISPTTTSLASVAPASDTASTPPPAPQAKVGGLGESGSGARASGKDSTLAHLSAKLQRFLDPVLSQNGHWVELAGHWLWSDANRKLWNSSLKRLRWNSSENGSEQEMPTTIWNLEGSLAVWFAVSWLDVKNPRTTLAEHLCLRLQVWQLASAGAVHGAGAGVGILPRRLCYKCASSFFQGIRLMS